MSTTAQVLRDDMLNNSSLTVTGSFAGLRSSVTNPGSVTIGSDNYDDENKHSYARYTHGYENINDCSDDSDIRKS